MSNIYIKLKVHIQTRRLGSIFLTNDFVKMWIELDEGGGGSYFVLHTKTVDKETNIVISRGYTFKYFFDDFLFHSMIDPFFHIFGSHWVGGSLFMPNSSFNIDPLFLQKKWFVSRTITFSSRGGWT